MSRSVAEWIGKNDDAVPPPRVRLRVFEKFNQHCAGCGLPLIGKRWTCDHIKALINDGENRESNLQPLGDACCNPKKNAADMALKSKSYRVRRRHAGVRPRSSFQTNRDGPFKKKMSGEVVRR
ncbi:MAG: HNH endonuclease [Bradyrhizobium sp.]|nr:HNH endonuclease [Bradyrhizobium sp.]